MIILINPRAAGGAALRRWGRFRSRLDGPAAGARTRVLADPVSMDEAVARELAHGEVDFVAAGGDGTVNALLNSLVQVSTPERLRRVRLGAVGLGSSNDFHKPLRRGGGIPASVRFEDAAPRDVGRLTWDDDGRPRTRYFLINASVGFAAAANGRFNAGGPLLRLIKRIRATPAIAAVVARTVISWRNIDVRVRCESRGEFPASLTHLGVAKSPHVGGPLSYGDGPAYRDGLFRAFLCHSMTRGEIVRLLGRLGRGELRPPIAKVAAWKTPGLGVSSAAPFPVEFDGEVVRTRSCRFEVLPGLLQVCP